MHALLPLLGLLATVPAGTTPATRAADAVPVVVRVQRVRPDTPHLATLRFFSANHDFLRGELDRLRSRTVREHGDALAIDPRFLAYGAMVAAARAEGDSAAAADSARSGRTLYARVTDLGALEGELDQLDRALAGQRERLATLQRDFTGAQRTELAVVLSGWPRGEAPASLTLALDDGSQVVVALDEARRDALRSGGAVQVLHRMLEPRAQLLSVAFDAGGSPAWLALEPERDRLNLLRLDLSHLPAAEPAALAATTWVLDSGTP